MKDTILLENILSDEKLYKLLIEVEKINKGKKITFHEFIVHVFFLKHQEIKLILIF